MIKKLLFIDKLIEMDEDVRTGFLLGSFIVTEIVAFMSYHKWLIILPLIFLYLFFYTIFKADKMKKEKSQNDITNE